VNRHLPQKFGQLCLGRRIRGSRRPYVASSQLHCIYQSIICLLSWFQLVHSWRILLKLTSHVFDSPIWAIRATKDASIHPTRCRTLNSVQISSLFPHLEYRRQRSAAKIVDLKRRQGPQSDVSYQLSPKSPWQIMLTFPALNSLTKTGTTYLRVGTPFKPLHRGNSFLTPTKTSALYLTALLRQPLTLHVR